MEKFLNDALTGVLWSDDAIICWLVRSKTQTCAKEGETIIFVRELTDRKPDYDLICEDIMNNLKIGDL